MGQEKVVRVRASSAGEKNLIQAIHLNAFGDSEGPIIGQLVSDLLSEAAVDLLSLVAEDESGICGSIIFTRVSIKGSEHPSEAFILSPLAVLQERHDQGIGSLLMAKGLELLKARGVDLVFVLGDPGYYSRAGFESAEPLGLKAPHPVDYVDAWMVQELNTGALANTEGLVQCCSSLSSPEHW